MSLASTASRSALATTSYGYGAERADSSQTVRTTPCSLTETTFPARRTKCRQHEQSCSVFFLKTGLVPMGNASR